MKINQQTGRVDFGNGLVVDPREGIIEFEERIPQEIEVEKIAEDDWCCFRFDHCEITDVEMIFDIRVVYRKKGKLDEITFSKTPTAEEMSDGRLWYVDYNEGLREEYNKLLQRLLGPQDFWEAIGLKAPRYRYDLEWGRIMTNRPTERSPHTEIEIRYSYK